MSTKKILVVEDEIPLANAVKLKLENNGFEVHIAENGKKALDIINNEFSLILLDLMMPEMDGFTFLEEIRKKGIKCKIFIMSNLSQQIDQNKVIELGASKFFIKSDVQLADMIEEVKKATE